jgi:ribosome biogenesis GTPase A
MKTPFKNRTYNPEIRRATDQNLVSQGLPLTLKKKDLLPDPHLTTSLSLSLSHKEIAPFDKQTNKQTKQNKNQIRPPSSQPISSPSISLRSPEIFSFHLLTLEKKNLKLHKEKRKTTHTFNHHPGPHFFLSKIAISPLPCSPFFYACR